jgi:hypothetical protein
MLLLLQLLLMLRRPVAVREVGVVLLHGWTVAAGAREGARHHPLAQMAVHLSGMRDSMQRKGNEGAM